MSVPTEYFSHTDGDFGPPDSSSPVNRLSAQHLQATTTPRKRVVLDYYPGTKEIATKFSLRNNSNFAVAFKVLSSFEIGYVAKPGMGIVQPGEAFDVTITVNDLQSAGRELEKDKFTIDLASVDSDQTSADNVAYEERRILFVGMSPAAKERLAYVAAEQRRNQQLDKLRSDRRRLMTYVGTGVLGLLGVVVLFVDFCALSSGNLYNEGGLKPAGG